MKELRFTYRCISDEVQAIDEIRDVLRQRDPWATRAAVLRASLRAAQQLIEEGRGSDLNGKVKG